MALHEFPSTQRQRLSKGLVVPDFQGITVNARGTVKVGKELVHPLELGRVLKSTLESIQNAAQATGDDKQKTFAFTMIDPAALFIRRLSFQLCVQQLRGTDTLKMRNEARPDGAIADIRGLILGEDVRPRLVTPQYMDSLIAFIGSDQFTGLLPEVRARFEEFGNRLKEQVIQNQ